MRSGETPRIEDYSMMEWGDSERVGSDSDSDDHETPSLPRFRDSEVRVVSVIDVWFKFRAGPDRASDYWHARGAPSQPTENHPSPD